MRQAKKERKKILDPNSIHTRPGLENSEKNRKRNQKIKKTPFWHQFQPKWDEVGREREKKILNLNSVHTRIVEGNSEKNS